MLTRYENLTIGPIPQSDTLSSANGIIKSSETVSTPVIVISRGKKCLLICCKIENYLVFMQLSIAIALAVIGLYLHVIWSTIPLQDTTFWSGFPLLLASFCGFYYCSTSTTNTSTNNHSIQSFTAKILWSTSSCISSIIALLASVYTAIHSYRIATMINCISISNLCQCSNQNSYVYDYRRISNCDLILTTIKYYLISESALNGLATCICFWSCGLLWKRRYVNADLEI